MANGTVTSIKENGTSLVLQITIGGAVYVAIVDKATFNALATNADKQNYIIDLVSATRRVSRQYEDIYPALIGTVLVIPD